MVENNFSGMIYQTIGFLCNVSFVDYCRCFKVLLLHWKKIKPEVEWFPLKDGYLGDGIFSHSQKPGDYPTEIQ